MNKKSKKIIILKILDILKQHSDVNHKLSQKDILYYLPYEMLKYFWDRAKEGGRKSFRYDELNPEYVIKKQHGILVPYLEGLKKDLEDRDID